MLSYRHAFHAGNLADVLKHSTLTAVLDAVTSKSTPLFYLDTHAGAGIYQFGEAHTEHRRGIEALRAANPAGMPHSIARYLDCIAAFNVGPSTSLYPGSAIIAARLLRDIDRLLLCERQPADFNMLANALRAHVRKEVQTKAQCGNGYDLLKSTLPPPERRGVILIDPAYELTDEPVQLINGLRAALSRFRHGVYLVWYPLHSKHDHATLKRHFCRLDPPKTLCIELDPAPPAAPGATGSGVLVVNPPFQAVAELNLLTAHLSRTLAPGGRAICEWLISE